MLVSSSEEYDTTSSDMDWIDRFVDGFTDQIILRVDQSFIDDPFNLFGISDIIKGYDKAIKAFRGEDIYIPPEISVSLYYMIHQRYILTKKGLDSMHTVISSGVYGKCPRVICNGYPFLPIGLSEVPHKSNVKLFCNNCKEIYEPRNELSQVDGCAFGSTFPNLFILMYKNLFPKKKQENQKYIPRIFGFKVVN
ncbi:casein kinase II subunit beta [Nematocida sp. ERTm5]|nr:casein kinase II subunit beta [Nematocida sp. ERTm5]